MADSTNSIDIVVQNSVDPGIAPRLITIADASDRADKSVGSLKSQLSGLSASGLGGLSAMFKETQGSIAALSVGNETLAKSTRASSEASQARKAALVAERQAAVALKESNAALALQNAADASDVKKYLADEAAVRQVQIKGFLEAAAGAELQAQAEQRLQDEWNKEQILTDGRIAKELELARARELSALKNDIIARSPDSVANDSAQATQKAELAAAIEQQALAEQALQSERLASEAQGSQMLLLEREMGNIRREDIILLDSQTVSSQRLSQVTTEQIALTDGLAAAEQSKLSAEERLLEINELVASVTGQVTRATVLDTEAKVANTAATRTLGSAVHGLTELQAASAASQIATGQSSRRAFENFLTKTLSLGPMLKAIFPVIGVIAFIQVINEAYTAIRKVVVGAQDAAHNIAIAFDGVIDPIRKSNDSLAVTNDRLDITMTKLEHRPTTNGTQLAIDQLVQSVDKLDTALERVDTDIEKVLNKNRINLIGSILTGNATTGDTEEFVRKQFAIIEEARAKATTTVNAAAGSKDLKATQAATLAAYNDERTAIQGTIKALEDKYNAVKKVQNEFEKDANKPVGSQFGLDQFGTSIVPSRGKDQTANLTEIGKSASLAREELRGLNLTIANMDKEGAVDKLRDKVSGERVEVKEAAKEWKALEAAYVSFQDKVTSTGHKPSLQDKLGFLQSQEATNNPLNKDRLAALEQPLKNNVAEGDQQVQRYADLAKHVDEYGMALKATTEIDRVHQELAKKGYELTKDEDDLLLLNISYYNDNRIAQEEKTKIERDAINVESLYAIAVKASNDVMRDHPELADAISRDLNRMKIAHDDAKDPLLEFNRGIEQSRSLLGQYGYQLEESNRVVELANELRSKGVTNWKEEAEAQRANITQLVQENALQQAGAELYDQTTGALERLAIAKKAVNAASSTELSIQAKQSAIQDIQGNQRDIKLNSGQGNDVKDPFIGALENYRKGFTTTAASLKKVYSDTFKTIGDGAADAFGRAIAYGQNLGEALKDVARSAIAELISGLIKLGIQLLVIAALKKLTGKDIGEDSTKKQLADQVVLTTASIASMTAITAAGLAASATLSAAWWPVAEAVSLATFGSNAVGAAAGLASVVAIGTASSIPKLSAGTNYVPNDTLAQIHQGERVIPKADNAKLLQMVSQGSPQGNGNSSRKPMTVNVHNYAGVAIDTQQIDESTITVIATRVARKAVNTHTDAATANSLNNPNSATAKALRTNNGLTRRRAS